MNVVEVYNIISNRLTDLRNTYGDNIESIEAYDGNIIIHFKSAYVKEQFAIAYTKAIINTIVKVLWWK